MLLRGVIRSANARQVLYTYGHQMVALQPKSPGKLTQDGFVDMQPLLQIDWYSDMKTSRLLDRRLVEGIT